MIGDGMENLLTVTETSLPEFPNMRRGKVRDIYDIGEELIIVATDRISAFDWVNPVGIPDKGKVLTQLSLFWFEKLADVVPHHVISAELSTFPEPFRAKSEVFALRSMRVKKCRMLPIEFVVRGYITGSGWKEYQQHGTVCGVSLPPGLREAEKLPEPIYTPATKEESGHDINITAEQADSIIGKELNRKAAAIALELYCRAHDYAWERGIIIADTKFEFGLYNGELMLADEILTPDSSRFWPRDTYAPGKNPPSYDKQFVRDFLETTAWDKNSPQPALPSDIVLKTREKYLEAYRVLTGKDLPVSR
jgi:phosphoribosylaminoimidazole-succinocarboxamide synthase